MIGGAQMIAYWSARAIFGFPIGIINISRTSIPSLLRFVNFLTESLCHVLSTKLN